MDIDIICKCGKKFKRECDLKRHYNSNLCGFYNELQKNGIVYDEEHNFLWVSGSAKISLILRDMKSKPKRDDDKKLLNNIEYFENKYAVKLSYNNDTDEVSINNIVIKKELEEGSTKVCDFLESPRKKLGDVEK